MPSAPSSLEQTFSNLLAEVTPARGVRLRIFVQGKPRLLKPAIQEQLFLIGREAVVNAFRHYAGFPTIPGEQVDMGERPVNVEAGHVRPRGNPA